MTSNLKNIIKICNGGKNTENVPLTFQGPIEEISIDTISKNNITNKKKVEEKYKKANDDKFKQYIDSIKTYRLNEELDDRDYKGDNLDDKEKNKFYNFDKSFYVGTFEPKIDNVISFISNREDIYTDDISIIVIGKNGNSKIYIKQKNSSWLLFDWHQKNFVNGPVEKIEAENESTIYLFTSEYKALERGHQNSGIFQNKKILIKFSNEKMSEFPKEVLYLFPKIYFYNKNMVSVEKYPYDLTDYIMKKLAYDIIEDKFSDHLIFLKKVWDAEINSIFYESQGKMELLDKQIHIKLDKDQHDILYQFLIEFNNNINDKLSKIYPDLISKEKYFLNIKKM